MLFKIVETFSEGELLLLAQEATGSAIVLNIFRLEIDLVEILVRARTPRLLG